MKKLDGTQETSCENIFDFHANSQKNCKGFYSTQSLLSAKFESWKFLSNFVHKGDVSVGKRAGLLIVELETKIREVSQCSEKALLITSAFTI